MSDGQIPSYIARLKRNRRRKKLTGILFLTLIVLGLMLGIYQAFKNIPMKFKWDKNILSVQTKAEPLKIVIDEALKRTKGTYGIVILNLKTGESFTFNETKSFEVGSLYKLWIMALIFKDIQEGKLSADESITGDIADLNRKFNIASDSAEFKNGTMSFTIKSALNQMITISHNYAALMLTEKVKVSRVKQWLAENGFNDSSVRTEGHSSPVSTPKDIARFYEKLYKGELGDTQSTQKMLELLKNQKLADGLPKNLPAEVKIANKTGEVGWFKHDSGIVFSEKGDYIIVVMSESNSPGGAQEKIALISKAVYDYFSKY
jgi:beta-lactamase class A